MLRNYLKVGVRNLLKSKFYSVINILGLTVGLTVSLLIIFYITDELSYDRFHKDYDKIYRVGLKALVAGQKIEAVVSPTPMSAILQSEMPEIESSIRLHTWEKINIQYEDKAIVEDIILLADSNFFDFFDFQLIEGDPAEALREVNNIVISEEAAIKYFNWQGPGDTSPLGKVLNLGTGDRTCQVSGIIENQPSNSHIPYDLVLAMVSWDYSRDPVWAGNNFYTYFKKNPKVPISETLLKFHGLVDKYVGPDIQEFTGKTMDQFREEGGIYEFFLQPMSDIHLKSNYEAELKPGGNLSYIYVFGAVALFIMILAVINYMNLATARSEGRAKEVGIRKTIGANKLRLTLQFISESVLFSILSTIPTLVMIYLLLPSFNSVSGKEIGADIFMMPELYIGLFGLAIIIGILAGSYPAFYLTSFQPVEALKGRLASGTRGNAVRSILVVFQFSISIILIICTLLVYEQLRMLQNKNLGFDKENVLVINNARNLGDKKITFRDELIKYEEVVNASISQHVPPHINNNTVFRPEGTQDDHIFYVYGADKNHIATFGYQMKSGRFFEEKYKSDTISLILNEAAMKQIGWEDFDGKRIKTYFFSDEGELHEVIGVVSDFNFSSLKKEIWPLVFRLSEDGNIISVRLSSGNIQEKVSMVKSKWEEFAPGKPFEYSFIDQDFDELFRSEQRLGNLAIIFTGLAIFVACLGLFGLATFISEQRAKEIGVRKIMGASSQLIVVLLSRQFTKLVLISFVLAIPASYYIIDFWLQEFPYKIDIGVMSFVIAGIGAVLISWITVGYQSYKAANGNPVNALRSE